MFDHRGYLAGAKVCLLSWPLGKLRVDEQSVRMKSTFTLCRGAHIQTYMFFKHGAL